MRETDILIDGLRKGRLSRRAFVIKAGALGLSLPAIGAILAACGSEGGGAETVATTAPSASTTAPAAATAAPAGSTPTTPVDVQSPNSATAKFDFKIPPYSGKQHQEMVDTSKFKKDPPWTLAYSDASQSNSWRVIVKRTMEYVVDDYNKKEGNLFKPLAYTEANDAIPKQLADIEDLLSRGIDALVIAITDITAICPAIEKAAAAGVPTIILERGVSCPSYTAYVNVDNFRIGELQMEFMCQALGGQGNIVVVSGIAGGGSSDDQIVSYKKVLEKYPGVKLLSLEYSSYSKTKGKQIMENMLQAYPQIDGIVVNCGIQFPGVYEAVEAAGRVNEIKAWTGDDNNGHMKLAVQKNLNTIVTPVPTWCARDAVDTAVKILRGQPVPYWFYVDSEPVLGADIAKFARLDKPDEFWMSVLPAEWEPF